MNEPGPDNLELRDKYNANRRHILARSVPGEVLSKYNVPTDDLKGGPQEIIDQLNDIYQDITETFKVNITFGLMLQHIETLEHRYFIPYFNRSLFTAPQPVSNLSDFDQLKAKVLNVDLGFYFRQVRPDTKYRLAFVTNIVFRITKTGFPLGKGLIPNYIKNKRCVETLEHPPGNRNHYYNDYLCAFRCLAIQNGQKHNIANSVKHYYTQWRTYLKGTIPKKSVEYKGVELSDLPEFERCFQVSVYLYDLQPEGVAILRYKSSCRFKSIMYLNIYEHHLSYIYNFKMYAHKFKCSSCEKHFKVHFNYKRHIQICNNRTKFNLPGGFFSPPKSIFDLLEEHGYDIPAEDRFFPWFAVFDFEAMLEKIREEPTEKLLWNQKHCPVSVSLCSNVDPFESPVCFIDSNLDNLLTEMFDYLDGVQSETKRLAKEKWGGILNQLEEEMKHWKPREKEEEEEEEEEGEGEEEEE